MIIHPDQESNQKTEGEQQQTQDDGAGFIQD